MVCLYDVLSYTMNYNIIPLYTYCRVFMNDSTIRLTAQNDKCIDISNYGTSDGSNIWYIHHLIYSQFFFFLLSFSIVGCLVVTLMTRSRKIKTRSGLSTQMEQSLA